MKKIVFVTAAACALIVTGVATAEQHRRGGGEQGPRGGARALVMLGAADLNGDNTVTRAEAEQLAGEEFAFRDRNADGYLDREDASPTRQRVAEARGDEGGERPRRGRGRGRPGAELDTDGDQRISRTEFLAGPSRLFERFDTNGDDAISPDELDAAVEARQARRDERREAIYWWRD